MRIKACLQSLPSRKMQSNKNGGGMGKGRARTSLQITLSKNKVVKCYRSYVHKPRTFPCQLCHFEEEIAFDSSREGWWRFEQMECVVG